MTLRTGRGAAVELRGFGWHHPTRERPSLQGVDLAIAPGERVLLLGRSGVGKSTLLHALAGVLEDDDGCSRLGSLTVDQQLPHAARGTAGLLQQDPQTQVVLSRVGDDVAFGPENLAVPAPEIWPRVDEAFDAVGLHLGRDRSTEALSGGQKQRLGLAGVVAMRPGLLLLDEPTASLDPDGVRSVRDAVVRVLETTGATLVVVEHRVEVWTDVIDRVVVLGEDGVRHDGPPGDVFGRAGAELSAAGIWVPGHEPRPARPPVGLVRTGPGPAAGTPLLRTVDLAVTRHQPGPGALRARRRAARRGRPVPAQALAPGPVAAYLPDLTLRSGEVLAITGANGAGKSTTALTLAGLLLPAGGAVEALPVLAGSAPADVTAWTGEELVGRIGVVFQEPEHQFVRGTVRGELEHGPLRAGLPDEVVRAGTDAMLELTGLTGLAEANPFTLSGGEKRRLSVASALLAAPAVLVLDEPTFGQDSLTWARVVGLLEAVREAGTCVVVVTHDRHLVQALRAREVTVGPAPSDRTATARAAAPRREGWLARRDALTKLTCALLLTLTVLVNVDPVTSGLVLGAELAALATVGLGPVRLLRALWPVLAACVATAWATTLLAEDSGLVILDLGITQITTGSAAAGAALGLRGLAMALAGVSVLLTTDPADLGDGLARTWRLPARFVLATLAALRMVEVLAREWEVLGAARRARGLGGQRRATGWLADAGGRTFALLVQALRRATRLAVTMEVRGFGAGPRTWARPLRRDRTDVVMIVVCAVLAVSAPVVSALLGAHRWLWG